MIYTPQKLRSLESSGDAYHAAVCAEEVNTQLRRHGHAVVSVRHLPARSLDEVAARCRDAGWAVDVRDGSLVVSQDSDDGA